MSERANPSVLIIGKDFEKLTKLQKGLFTQNFTPGVVRFNQPFPMVIDSFKPQTIILEDGSYQLLKVLSQVNQCRPDLPILVVGPKGPLEFEMREVEGEEITVKKANPRLIQILDAGAAHYEDSFNPDVLGAHIRAIIRGWRPYLKEWVVGVDDLEVNLTRRTVSLAGSPLKLNRTEWYLIALLAKHFNKVVEYTELINLWEPKSRDITNLRVAVARLREKVEKDSERPEKIHNVEKLGYLLGNPPV